MKVTGITKEKGVVTNMTGEFLPNNKNFKKIHRLNWVANCGDAIPVKMVEYDYLFNCDVLPDDAKGEKFWDYVNVDSKFETMMMGESNLRSCQKGTFIL